MRGQSEEQVVWRARLLAVCVFLAAVAFRQKPGLVVADTKLDLTVSPWGFLGRSLHLWDPNGAFGQLQNQAYGYLLPMGPFHGALLSAGAPPWVVQRLWWSLLLCLAFLGTWRVATELDLGSRWARLAGALAYALSPRIASELTITSAEVWPMAVAPWVLLPLVVATPRSWWWRISRSALAVALAGGVNAVAVGATLVLPALWFVTRRPQRQTVLAGLAWLATVAVAISWWLVPLVVLGRYSPPFLDWIESSAVTTGTASPFEALRGTTAWLGFLSSVTGPEWPGGWLYNSVPVLIISTVLVAGVGLVGLTLRRTPERVFLALAVLVGVALLTMGHTSSVGGPFGATVQGMLDGTLAALRNAHKFDVVVRLPLALALVSAVEAAPALLRGHATPRWLVPVGTLALLVAATAPSLTASLARTEAYRAVPQYWVDAARWLDAQPDQGTALLVPAASFADFTWGSTKDDPLQALMRRPMAVRDAVPLGSAGATRWLDGVQRDLGSGQGSAGLRATLAAAGVRFVVVRNDLRLDAQGDPLIPVRAALAAAGLPREAAFGPLAGYPGESSRSTVDYRTLLQRPSVEIFGVQGAAVAAQTPLDRLRPVAGGPEDLTDVVSATGDRYTAVGTDGPAAGAGQATGAVVTDGLRRREVAFGKPAHNTSQVLTASEQMRQRRPVADYVADPEARQTVRAWRGVAGVSASSSAADADATLRLGPAASPAAALDGDLTTRWVSGVLGGVAGQWLEVRLERPTALSGIQLRLSTGSPVGSVPARITVTTERGARAVDVTDASDVVSLSLPTGPTAWVRVTASDVARGPANGFSIAEVTLPGLTPAPSLAVPSATRGEDVVTLGRDPVARSGCTTVDNVGFCSPSLVDQPEESGRMVRDLSIVSPGSFQLRGTVLATDSAATDRLLEVPGTIGATASSRLVGGPVGRPGAALDRDLATGWVAGRQDPAPTFTVTLPEKRPLTGFQFLRDPQLAASGAAEVLARFDDGSTVRGRVSDDGYLRFPLREVGRAVLTFGATRPLVSVDSRSGAREYVPVGFSELRVLGAEDLRRALPSSARAQVPCGFGPTVDVDGRRLETAVDGTLGDLAAGRTLDWRVCSREVGLRAGPNRLTMAPSAEFAPVRLELRRSGLPVEGQPTRVLAVERPAPTALRVEVAGSSEPTVVSVAQNYNPGWRATIRGLELRPVRVNGWMQGWVVPAGGAGTLAADFRPDAPFRAGLAGGGMMLLALAGAAVVLGRRGIPRPPPPALIPGGGTGIALVTLGGLLLAGWVGLVLAVLAVAACTAAALRGLSPHVWGVIGLTLGAGLLVAARPWPGAPTGFSSVLVQVLTVSAVLLASAGAVLPRRPLSEPAPAGTSSSRPDAARESSVAVRAGRS
jgi:arabinofuranan 3-O-arabinosyltransferase